MTGGATPLPHPGATALPVAAPPCRIHLAMPDNTSPLDRG